MSLDNYNQYNISLAHIVGLEASIYINEILKIKRKAVKKSKIKEYISADYNDNEAINTFFTVDRDYVQERTTLSVAKQLELDKKLSTYKIIKSTENPNEICIDEKLIISLFVEKNETVLKDIKKTTTSRAADKDSKEAVAREKTKLALKVADTELYELYKNWVDSIYENPKAGFLTAAAAKTFKATLENFANGRRDAVKELIEIALTNSYKNPDWAINVYKTRHKIRAEVNRLASIPVSPITNENYQPEDLPF